jgi:aromatic ring hydroxylase
VVDEIIVTPTRAMGEEDADYAVAFAVPAASPGLTLISRPDRAGDTFDFPVSGRRIIVESLTVFEDVFVPWDRVFLAGEWQHAGEIANTFATWHRFTAVSYKTPVAELMLGTAALLAEMNGVEKASHVRENLVDMAIYLHTLDALGRAAARECVVMGDAVATPNPLVVNIGKYYFANNYHAVVKALQEIAGGLMVTAPGGRDVSNDRIRPLIDKYLAGGNNWMGIDRVRAMKLATDLTSSNYGGALQVASIHAEGSLAAQRISVLRETDVNGLMTYAKRVARIGADPGEG